MNDRELVLRVAARHQRQVRASWDGKLASKEWRLTWTYHNWKLEELPAKGKRQLGVAEMQTNLGLQWLGDTSLLIPENILRDARVSMGDSYDQVKAKIQAAMAEAGQKLAAKLPDKKDLRWLTDPQWNEERVHFLKVIPEGVEPFNAEGADFTVKVDWTTFKAYSPNSDFQQADPHYTLYEASAPAAARKFFQILKEDPSALKSISWAKFDDWLKANKIGYKTHFSQWH